MITDKQKNFILKNIYALSYTLLLEVVKNQIDKISKEDASKIIQMIIKELNENDMEGLPFEAIS